MRRFITGYTANTFFKIGFANVVILTRLRRRLGHHAQEPTGDGYIDSFIFKSGDG